MVHSDGTAAQMTISIELVPANEGTTFMWRGKLQDACYRGYASDHNPQAVLNTLMSAYIMKEAAK